MRIVLLAIVLVALHARTADAAEEVSPASLLLMAEPSELLGDRFRLCLPDLAEQSMRPHDIMGAPHSNWSEDRVTLDHGDARFVMMVFEKFAHAGGDLPSAADRLAAVRGRQMGTTYTRSGRVDGLDGLAAISYVPDEIDAERDAINIYLVMVANTDDTLQELAFFLNPEGLPDREGWVELAQRVTATIVPGERDLDARAGRRELKEGYSLTVPERHVAYTQPGPDFLVHHVVKLVRYGSPPARMSVYYGNHPSLSIWEAKVTEDQVETIEGTLLDARVKWWRWHVSSDDESASTCFQETIVFNADRWAYHVFMHGPSTEVLDSMQQIAESSDAYNGPFAHPDFQEDLESAGVIWWYVGGALVVVAVAFATAMLLSTSRRRSNRTTSRLSPP